MSFLLVTFSPLLINSAMSVVKWLGSLKETAAKRFWLALLSFIGVLAYSALTGTPVDPNSFGSIVQSLIEAVGVFLMSHGTYDLWNRLRTVLLTDSAPADLPTT